MHESVAKGPSTWASQTGPMWLPPHFPKTVPENQLEGSLVGVQMPTGSILWQRLGWGNPLEARK